MNPLYFQSQDKAGIKNSPFKVTWKGELPPNGQIFDWGLRLGKVPAIWATTKGEGVKVGIIDTGIDKDHPDLQANLKSGKDFSSYDESDFEDRQGHGSHCAGIIAAINNDQGVVGVAPKAGLYIAKGLGDNGSGSFQQIADAVDWLVDVAEVDIISMSLGANGGAPVLHEALKRAHAKGVVLIAAAGNDGNNYKDSNTIDWPGRYPECIAVGAINKYEERAWFSSNGNALWVMAAGADVTSTYRSGGYATLSGTSMATPFIAGVVALMLSKHYNQKSNTPIYRRHKETPLQVREHLAKTALDRGDKGKDNFFGYGIVDPGAFVASCPIG